MPQELPKQEVPRSNKHCVQCTDIGGKRNLQSLVNLSAAETKECIIRKAKTFIFLKRIRAAELPLSRKTTDGQGASPVK